MPEDSSVVPLEHLISKLFISRPDVKAVQSPDGAYRPDVVSWQEKPVRYRPWDMQALTDHLAGTRTYGHYMLSSDNQAKLFAFDIDLDKTGILPLLPLPEDPDDADWMDSFTECNPREVWLDRASPARSYIKYSMRHLAEYLQQKVEGLLSIPTAVAYTGAKGLHVYGFTGRMAAAEVRAAMMYVLKDLPGEWVRGDAFWKSGYTQDHSFMTVECFPKQDTLGQDGFGNLMRLPLGRNLKSPDPTFFLDLERTAMGVLLPADPREILERVLKEVEGS